MLKALADRLAEAFAEALHQRVRTDLWGYAPDEALSNEDADRARSTAASAPRPATRPARTTASSAPMFDAAAAATDIGMALTESLAMMPAASVSGFYLSHPDSDLLQRRQDRPGPGAKPGGAAQESEADLARLLAPNL